MKEILLLALAATLSYSSFCQQIVDVTEQTLKIGSMKEEELYFGFAEGDQIIFNFTEADKKELKEVEIIEYPANSKFSDYKTARIEEKRLNVLRTGVYKFRFQNSAIGGRVCKIKIQRIPASDATKFFNTNVSWVERQDTTWNSYTKDVIVAYDTAYQQKTKKELVKTEQKEELLVDKTQRVHSITNENGNKTSIFFTLPRNQVVGNMTSTVISWAYWVGVGEEANQAWKQNSKALTSLAKGAATYFTTPLGALAIGAVADLAVPKIGEVVLYSIADMANKNLFLAGQPYRVYDQGKGVAGYRKFADRGLSQGTFAVCMANDNMIQGIDVAVKVVAIVETKYFEDQPYTEQIVTPRYEKKIFKDPVIQKAKVPVTGI